DENLFIFFNRHFQPLHGNRHIFHQEWIVKLIECRTEKLFSRLKITNAALQQDCGEVGINVKDSSQRCYFLNGMDGIVYPALFHYPFNVTRPALPCVACFPSAPRSPFFPSLTGPRPVCPPNPPSPPTPPKPP